jgi:hypothetical protein
MGSNPQFVSIKKAAKILGRSVPRVQDFIDQGLMAARTNDDGVVEVNQEHLAEIHRLNIAGEMKPGELIRRLLFCERKIERLEMALDLIMEVNGLKASRFSSISDADLINLHDNARDALGEEAWIENQMGKFCEVFCKITEVEIDRLNDLLQVDHSWQTFYQLCLAMTRYVGMHPELDTTLNLQRIRDLLYAGRKNLSTIAVLFIEKSAQLGPSRKLLMKVAASDIDLFDHLAKQLKKTGHAGHLQIR